MSNSCEKCDGINTALLAALERMLAAYVADKDHGLTVGNDQAADQARAAIARAKGV